MDGISFFVLVATVAAVSFSWASFLLKYKKLEEEELEEVEQRILDLMGRFKHVSNIRLELLDKKVEEVKRVIREANDIYASLAIKISDLMKIKEDILSAYEEENDYESQGGNVNDISEEKRKRVDEVSKNLGENMSDMGDSKENNHVGSVERKILMLHDEGLSEIEIAKKLGIGVGEVKLMISLFRRGR